MGTRRWWALAGTVLAAGFLPARGMEPAAKEESDRELARVA